MLKKYHLVLQPRPWFSVWYHRQRSFEYSFLEKQVSQVCTELPYSLGTHLGIRRYTFFERHCEPPVNLQVLWLLEVQDLQTQFVVSLSYVHQFDNLHQVHHCLLVLGGLDRLFVLQMHEMCSYRNVQKSFDRYVVWFFVLYVVKTFWTDCCLI